MLLYLMCTARAGGERATPACGGIAADVACCQPQWRRRRACGSAEADDETDYATEGRVEPLLFEQWRIDEASMPSRLTGDSPATFFVGFAGYADDVFGEIGSSRRTSSVSATAQRAAYCS
jgi:hypothetical protein